jgi:hypothetical protein
MYCAICGSQKVRTKFDKVSHEQRPIVHRFWDCDDGWKAGHLCKYWYEDVKDTKPKETDYAYREKDKLFTDMDSAEVIIYG